MRVGGQVGKDANGVAATKNMKQDKLLTEKTGSPEPTAPQAKPAV